MRDSVMKGTCSAAAEAVTAMKSWISMIWTELECQKRLQASHERKCK